MKTYNQFCIESYTARENLYEIAPALAVPLVVGGKVLGYGLAAYSAYNAIKNLSKGNYGQAAWDALGAVPGGKVFQGARALGAGRNLSRAASATQSALRWGGPTAVSKLETKVTDAALNKLTGGDKTQPQPAQPASSTPPTQPAQPASSTPTAQPVPSKSRPSNVVLAPKGGIQGKLDKSTGKWTKGDWTQQESDRYKRVKNAIANK